MTTPAGPDDRLWSHFAAKAELVGTTVVRVRTHAESIAALRDAGADLVHTGSLLEQFPDVANEAGALAQRGSHPPEVVAAGRAAVAETGSVLLNEPDADRAACFLAERLWLLVGAEQIVPSLEGALERIQALIRGGAHHPQLVTGPSRTADIERTLTVGVHGPRALVVVVVGNTSSA